MLDPTNPTPGTIWSYAQNKPSLVCADLERLAGIPQAITARVLMARGVYKWLSARRDLIRLKNVWKDELTRLYRAIESGEIRRGSPEHREALGRIRTLEECRAQVRAICHSERWRIPDNDPRGGKLLEETP